VKKSKSEILWQPNDESIKRANLTSFITFVNKEYDTSFSDFYGFYNWSVTEIEKFWEALWKYSGIIHSKSYDKIVDERKMPGAKWFEGAELNFAENLLRYRDDEIALMSYREDHPVIRLTYKELYTKVAACAAGLRELGVVKNDSCKE